MSKSWTPEQRAAAAQRIHEWKPWERSTGPRTAEGKAISAMNRYQGAKQKVARENARDFRRVMKAIQLLTLEHRRVVQIDQRIRAGLPVTDWHLARAPLPDASILLPVRDLEPEAAITSEDKS